MFTEDAKDYSGDNNDDDVMPEWADEKITSDVVDVDDTSFLMLRMSSHFLSTILPRLEEFVRKNINRFFESGSNIGTSAFSLLQYDLYQEYTEIFEQGMESFLKESSKEELVQALKRANEKESQGRESMGTIMLELISALSCFEGELQFRCAPGIYSYSHNMMLSFTVCLTYFALHRLNLVMQIFTP